MFIVKTYVDKSTIEGLGVFSSDQIKKGETVWTFDPTFDRQFTPEQVANFPKTARDHILKCGFLDPSCCHPRHNARRRINAKLLRI